VLKRLCFVACGTSWHAALIGKYLVEAFARLPVEVDIASEFRYRKPVVDGRVLTVTISQSGETADTLAALREAKGQGSRAVAICNVVGSSLAREADGVVYTRAGVEIGVAATKVFTAAVVAVHAPCAQARPREGLCRAGPGASGAQGTRRAPRPPLGRSRAERSDSRGRR